ncbi:uncharacterized protein N7473_006751 [Penicillium subrubescens]|uniref:uncharacterized protein n=1 Tax=Penicillium subrubescens TaxID=1316194 RepID=UPI002544E095|nr:uncharacterized protein N7473_006751 [Penicillium subrubescens]KAJ5890523.1 hypothetical protein N7473_006751 [Penicillium subrubescens]
MSRRAPAAKKQQTLQFVTIDPSSDQGSSHIRRIVRSHAGGWIWRQLRDSQDNPQPDPEEEEEEDELEAGPSVREESQGRRQSTSQPRKPSPSVVGSLWEAPREFAPELVQRAGNGGRPMQLSRVSSEKLDPFQSYISTSPLPSGLVSNSNKYCLSVLWPGLMPRSSLIGGAPHAGIEGWFSISLGHPALHSAMLFGSYSHRRIMWLQKRQSDFSAEDEKQMAICEADSITRINLAIQNLSEALTDAIILCVLCMANNKNEPPLGPDNLESPFQAPLRSLQWLDVYGRLKPHPVHQIGLVQLVQLKGGWRRLSYLGLLGSGVLGASRLLSPPLFSYICIHEGEYLTLRDIIDSQHPVPTVDPNLIAELPITYDMQEIFRAARAYFALVDKYQDGIHVPLDTLADCRNLIQWHIMSLLSGSQLGARLIDAYPLYESCRLALVILGVSVIFPLPPQSAPLLELSRMLQAELQSTKDFAKVYSSVSTKLVYWCLVLGGIAATGSSERRWYVEEIRRLAGPYGLREWDSMKQDLKTILWLDRACDFGGRLLWEEALRLQ